jgi:hypothetical protein
MNHAQQRFDQDVARLGAPILNRENGLAFLSESFDRFEQVVRVYRTV